MVLDWSRVSKDLVAAKPDPMLYYDDAEPEHLMSSSLADPKRAVAEGSCLGLHRLPDCGF